MRLGCTLGSLGGVGSEPAAYVEFARAAERLGYDSAWSAEGFGTDPVSLLGWIAGQTTTIGLGTAVMQLSSRSPVTAAMTAATLAQISGGRFRLGLGPSGPKVVEGWHGQAYRRPLARTRDYVAVVRMALAGQPVQYDGETITLPVTGSGVAPMPMHVPAQLARVPVYLAGLGPKSIELAGEIADGWLPVHCPPEFVARSRARLAAGAERAGRSLAGFDVAVMAFALVDEDLELARDSMRPLLALYLGGMGTSSANFYYRLAGRLGFGAAAAAIQEAYLQGYLDEAAAAVPDELVDTMTMAGPPDRVRERLAAYRDAGTSTLIIAPVPQSLPERCEQLEWIAELVPEA
jgi:F420-dependent oxidoreductase-like protein